MNPTVCLKEERNSVLRPLKWQFEYFVFTVSGSESIGEGSRFVKKVFYTNVTIYKNF